MLVVLQLVVYNVLPRKVGPNPVDIRTDWHLSPGVVLIREGDHIAHDKPMYVDVVRRNSKGSPIRSTVYS